MDLPIIQKEYRESRAYMRSAVGDQQEITLWNYVVDKNGEHYFWPVEHDEPGAMVHCGFTVMAGKKRSEGYAGRTMQFPTKDGVIDIQGPWHTNTDHLFKATGVDIRDKHRTFGLICLERDHDKGETIFRDIIYIDADESGVVGTFDRMDKMAQEIADRNDEVVFYFSRSHGGSSAGPKHPSSWSREKQEAHWKERNKKLVTKA